MTETNKCWRRSLIGMRGTRYENHMPPPTLNKSYRWLSTIAAARQEGSEVHESAKRCPYGKCRRQHERGIQQGSMTEYKQSLRSTSPTDSRSISEESLRRALTFFNRCSWIAT